MDVRQIYTLMNTVTNEILGESDIVAEDLSNVVDVGTAIFSNTSVDKYVQSLVDHIGKVVFIDRKYEGMVPSMLRDGWEYGAVLEVIDVDLPDATENETYSLVNGNSYDPNIFYKPTVSAKFYNKKVTFEVPISFAETQVKSSFSSLTELNKFLSTIYTAVDNSMTIKLEALIMRTISNMIGETLVDADSESAGYGNISTTRAVNLLKLYNDKFNASLTAETCIYDADFNKFASYIIGLYTDRMRVASTLFNIEGKERFTSKDNLHIVMLSDFAKASDVYLQSDVYHNDLTSLPNGIERVPYWQGSGTDYGFASVSDIHINTASGNEVVASGILGVMFDTMACMVACENRRTTSNYNAKAEFYTNFNKWDAMYLNNMSGNFVVFYVADATA